MRKKDASNANQLLTVYINESKDEDVRDFIVNRNPDLALTVNFAAGSKGATTNMTDYLKKLEEQVSHVNQIRFENLHRFFYHSYHVV